MAVMREERLAQPTEREIPMAAAAMVIGAVLLLALMAGGLRGYVVS